MKALDRFNAWVILICLSLSCHADVPQDASEKVIELHCGTLIGQGVITLYSHGRFLRIPVVCTGGPKV
jgi:hypothetical protein